jgi:hypothetical protein
LEIKQDIKEQFGSYPTYTPHLSSNEGLVYVAKIGNKIVSTIGYVETHDKNGNKKLKLVELE